MNPKNFFFEGGAPIDGNLFILSIGGRFPIGGKSSRGGIAEGFIFEGDEGICL